MIKLELKKQLIFRSIFILFKKKLGFYQKYQEENLKKRFIKRSQLLVKYLIFLIFKKNRTFCLFIYNQDLNFVIIKN